MSDNSSQEVDSQEIEALLQLMKRYEADLQSRLATLEDRRSQLLDIAVSDSSALEKRTSHRIGRFLEVDLQATKDLLRRTQDQIEDFRGDLLLSGGEGNGAGRSARKNRRSGKEKEGNERSS